jgi:ACS family glucarate transporter-like MFS transporter
MGKPLIPKRVLLVIGTFLLTIVLYIDRSCISVAKEGILADLQLTDKQFGWIVSAFALGYAFFQVPAGAMADRFGPRRVLSCVVAFWATFTGLTGFCGSYLSMIVCRFLFGAGEAGAFPGIARASFSWIPMKERGLVTGINFSGSRIGGALALPLIAILISKIGWRHTFMLQASFGLCWAFFWYLWFRDDPTQHKRITSEELNYILTNRQQTKAQQKDKVTPAILLRSTNMWLTMFQYFASNITFFFCLSWAFSYIKKRYSLDFVDAAIWTGIPLLGGAVGNWIAGFMVDSIYKQGKWQLSRRLPAIIGFALAAIGVVGFIFMEDIVPAILFLTIAILGADMTLSPSWSLCVDIGKKHAGSVSGMMNMAGNIGSFVTGLAYPYLNAWTGSDSTYFYLAAVLNVLAIFAWMMIKPEKTLEEY